MWDSVGTLNVGREDKAIAAMVGRSVKEGICETGAAADDEGYSLFGVSGENVRGA